MQDARFRFCRPRGPPVCMGKKREAGDQTGHWRGQKVTGDADTLAQSVETWIVLFETHPTICFASSLCLWCDNEFGIVPLSLLSRKWGSGSASFEVRLLRRQSSCKVPALCRGQQQIARHLGSEEKAKDEEDKSGPRASRQVAKRCKRPCKPL